MKKFAIKYGIYYKYEKINMGKELIKHTKPKGKKPINLEI
jgi:hypothetical protein